MEDNRIRVGITQGDVNGVGYEVILQDLFRAVDVGVVYTYYIWFAQSGSLSPQITLTSTLVLALLTRQVKPHLTN